MSSRMRLGRATDLKLDFILAVGVDFEGLIGFGLFRGHPGIGHDDDDIADLDLSGGGAVEADLAGMAFGGDDIGFKPGSVVIIDDLHPFSFQDPGGIHELFVDGDAPHVVEVGLRHRSPMDLGFEHL